MVKLEDEVLTCKLENQNNLSEGPSGRVIIEDNFLDLQCRSYFLDYVTFSCLDWLVKRKGKERKTKLFPLYGKIGLEL